MTSEPPDHRRARHPSPWATVVLVAVLATAGVACSGDDGADGDAAPSDLVASMWAQDDPVVAVDRPDQLFLPGPELPDDVVLSDVARPDHAPASTPALDPLDPTGPAQTLYADPDAPSPEQGPALVVGRSDSSDSVGGLGLPEGQPVDVGHEGAQEVEIGDLLVIRWPVLWTCDTVAAVGTDQLGSSGSANALDDPATAGPIAMAPVTSLGGGGGPVYRVLLGHVAAEVTDVEIAVDGLAPTAAAVADVGPGADRRWIAAVVDVAPLGLRPPTGRAVARDDAGTEVARIPV